jgi:8-amino-7-oxononanoate synthase
MRDELARRLAALEAEGLRRSSLVLTTPPGGPEVEVQGGSTPVINLASNDYLGLASHPDLRRSAAEAARRLGGGSGAARLVSGTLADHVRLEEALAQMLDQPKAVLFGSGYLAHVGTIPALADDEADTIYSDQRNHASIVDGCRLARGETRIYRHLDTEHLEALLERDASRRGRRLVVTESVFSMDGDDAPLEQIARLAAEHDAWVLVDEAHAFGVRGPRGAGLVAERGLQQSEWIRMGTLGKAAGSYGAFVAGPAELVEYLVNRARTFVYSTALPPAAVAAGLTAVQLIGGEEGDRRRAQLTRAATCLREGLVELGLELAPVPGPIFPLMVGDARRAVGMARGLLRRNVLARAMRYPTVPRGTERLRLVATAAHTDELLARALAAFAELGRDGGEGER